MEILEQAQVIVPPKDGSYIYFLIHDDVVVYVGKSNTLLSRLGSHTGSKKFNYIKYISVAAADQDMLESALILALAPKYNSFRPRELSEIHKTLLEKYNCKGGVIRAELLSLPHPEHYGEVIFLDKGKLKLGLYDDDETNREDDDHDPMCLYSEFCDAIDDLDIPPDALEKLDETASGLCQCELRAIVFVRGDKSTYRLISKSRLHALPGDDRYRDFHWTMDDLANHFKSEVEHGRS